MSAVVALSCTCGAVNGEARSIVPANSSRVICSCRDCQTFAHFLGRPQDIIDQYGGTDIFQLTPSQIVISKGREHIRCMRLSDKGMMRFYTECCRTPMGNTLASAKVAFVGVPHNFMKHGARTRDQDLGPVLSRVNVHSPKEFSGSDGFAVNSMLPIFRILRMMIFGWFKKKYQPSPYFDLGTGKPVARPTVLSPSQRAELRKRTIPLET